MGTAEKFEIFQGGAGPERLRTAGLAGASDHGALLGIGKLNFPTFTEAAYLFRHRVQNASRLAKFHTFHDNFPVIFSIETTSDI